MAFKSYSFIDLSLKARLFYENIIIGVEMAQNDPIFLLFTFSLQKTAFCCLPHV
jgi:hypothetical protein